MTASELDRLILLGRAQRLTPEEQGLIADALEEYRGHALRLERAVHELVKDSES